VRLFRAALGPLADDPVAMAVTRTTIGPPLHYMLLMTGLSRSDAVEAQLDVVIPWLENRLALRETRRRRAEGRRSRPQAHGAPDRCRARDDNLPDPDRGPG
jgi:hypothetical protein